MGARAWFNAREAAQRRHGGETMSTDRERLVTYADLQHALDQRLAQVGDLLAERDEARAEVDQLTDFASTVDGDLAGALLHARNERDLLRNERDLLRTEVERLAHLNGAIERVRALHEKAPSRAECAYDDRPWPCRTIQALEKP